MSSKRKYRGTILKTIKYLLLFVLAVIGIGVCALLGIYKGSTDSAPALEESNVLPTTNPSVILDDAGNELIQLSSQGARRTEATSEEIPDTIKWAFIDLEDERFYDHNGIDLTGLLRAFYVDLTSDSSEGASTITQQLIKNNVFETGGYERSTLSTVKRKLQEWKLATELEQQMSKEEILVDYLNTINLGGGNYGIKEAAKYYFGKDLADLTVSECAVIASITQNPSKNNPASHPENNWKRAQICLEYMYKNGHITEAEYNEAMNDDVYSRIIAVANQNAGEEVYSYFVDCVVQQVLEDLQTDAGYTYAQAYNAVYSGGITIYSTQNSGAQQIVDNEINNEENYSLVETSYSISLNLTIKNTDGTYSYYSEYTLRNYFDSLLDENTTYLLDYATKEDADAAIEEYKAHLLEEGGEVVYESVYYTLQPQASFTLMDYTTGHVLAISGGRGAKETSLSLNRATGTNRQPGSLFKVVAAFAPALDLGLCTLATTFDDAPLSYGGETNKSIANWWGEEYRGLSPIRSAIRDSMNIIACKTLYTIGASNCLPYLRSFGYKSIVDEDANMSTAIGGVTYGVTNLENCAAFSAIANDGVYNEPLFYTKVVAKDGSIILDTDITKDSHEVISEETASLLTSAMIDVVESGTGMNCKISNAPLAGKTGSTNDYRDVWFTGYIPNGLCACIWMGYDSNATKLYNTPEIQKKFYSKIMEQIVDFLGQGGGSFEMKGDIVQAQVCSKSGLLANEYCASDPAGSTIVTEYFRADTVPTTTCTVHASVEVCTVSGDLATSYCPSTTKQVVRIRPMSIDGTSPAGTTWDSPYTGPTSYCTVHTASGTSSNTDDDDDEDGDTDVDVTTSDDDD